VILVMVCFRVQRITCW